MRKYDDEFKREAVKKIHDGQSVASVARELGVAESLLHNWKRQTMEASSDSEKEVIALRRQLREQARSETFSYIEGYHNRMRRHSALGYKTPEEFEREINVTKKGASSERVVSSKT